MSDYDLRLGRWQDVLDGVTCDLLLVDAPYSDKTHAGHYAGTDLSGDRVYKGRSEYPASSARRPLNYGPWTADDVDMFVSSWAPRCRGWFVTITDHVLAPVWTAALERAGRYVFAPLPFLEIGKQPRLTGDGPASWTCWIVVSRPSKLPFSAWGSLPGGYATTVKDQRRIPGGKPLHFMRDLVLDYSRPGDVVCDPCAGGATTLLAALITGRQAVGAEVDPNTYRDAVDRLQLCRRVVGDRVVYVDASTPRARKAPAGTVDLFAGGE